MLLQCGNKSKTENDRVEMMKSLHPFYIHATSLREKQYLRIMKSATKMYEFKQEEMLWQRQKRSRKSFRNTEPL